MLGIVQHCTKLDIHGSVWQLLGIVMTFGPAAARRYQVSVVLRGSPILGISGAFKIATCAGMNWVPDDAWRMVVDSVGVDRKASPTCGPVSVAFKHCKEAKAWIAMLMQMQRLAWELHLMEVSGVQLSQAVFAMFEMPPTAESGHEQAHRFVALRALHALLLPTRSATLSAGIKSLCTQSPSPTVQDPQ